VVVQIQPQSLSAGLLVLQLARLLVPEWLLVSREVVQEWPLHNLPELRPPTTGPNHCELISECFSFFPPIG
jgi:hypothetical protein